MRYFGICLLFVAAAWAGAPSLEAQDRSPFLGLFGKRSDSSKHESPRPGKHVEINLTDQMLRAYEGNRLVMKTRISSGRNRATPTGRFRAGWKDEDHYSSLFNNAPMPWSVQVSGNIFVHGSPDVPDYAASHGCIRVPIDGRNPAKRFFTWCDAGTPIVISY